MYNVVWDTILFNIGSFFSSTLIPPDPQAASLLKLILFLSRKENVISLVPIDN